MAIVERTKLNEFFVRFTDAGDRIQGAHLADRYAVVKDGVELSSSMLPPRAVDVNDAAALGPVATAINLASLATVADLQAQVATLQAEATAAASAYAELEKSAMAQSATVEDLRAQLAAATAALAEKTEA